jgi:hypothetical protein
LEPIYSEPAQCQAQKNPLAASDRDGAIAVREGLVGAPPEALAKMQTQPTWAARLDAAHTIPREPRALEIY